MEVQDNMYSFYILNCGSEGKKLVNTMLFAWFVSLNMMKEFEDIVVLKQNSFEC